ncbi:dihydrolipoyl dehydrogenase [Methylocystis sp. MJC1]|jgi:dihydrolipoamide dehydrogenase|uniref:dihydrolipoyl dehydrogenase n=1 Tax=Methylocystis sp. MJC1 TaxID=2654282 RepID=UPI0013EDB962|nr:dihydrolipoyl dehydrogenase [Methylocystis sp. MJC1]KAF2990427.1 Dihydrolipoyl dehydrogenase 3 [Methylocystis sp. MJC1]MBU6528222.1 dihydrolipoyl dehydrogenase [Methylocystis sp. MJC1]UZX11130.1 dihydrolipoyl dehydrogenase [Methylocystis sp. MJC1]
MTYDLVVIGSGPGGYVCAIRAAQLGLKTAVVEKDPTYGGTCLNVGCIPSKALLHASHMFEEAGHGLAPLGVIVDPPKLDLAAMMRHKNETVGANVNGVAFLFKKNKVVAYRGVGRLAGAGKVEVTGADGASQTIETKNIVIATGSAVAPLRDASGAEIQIDEKVVVSSTGALSLEKVPQRLIVIGAGVIGLELGSVWRRLGAQVTAIEYLDRVLPGFDFEVASRFQKLLEKQGFAFKLSSKVTGVAREGEGEGVVVSYSSVDGATSDKVTADVVLVATGRTPYTQALGLEEAGVALERGRVIIDDHFATNIPGVYAIGDVVRGPMLAHKAEDEGVAVAEILAGQAGHVNYNVIPSVVYTMPEVASVGVTEEDAKAKGLNVAIGKFPFSANGRARSMRETDGFVKFIADAATDRVVGVHILGAGAGELIAEAAVLMEFSGSSEDLARTCHAHPTMSEAMKEAALAVAKRAIHI